MKTNKIFICLFTTLFLVLITETGYAAPGCREDGSIPYQNNLRIPFDNIKEFDSSALEACAAAISALSNLSVAISLVTINLGAIINAIIGAALSAACSYANGQLQSRLDVIDSVFNDANVMIHDIKSQRDLALNSSNEESYNVILNSIESGIEGDTSIKLNR